MTPDILAKIMGISAKTGDRVIVVDSASATPFVLMSIDQYEKLLNSAKSPISAGFDARSLTSLPGSGMIEPESAILQEAAQGKQGDWGGDETTDEEKFYMEPVE